MDQKPIVHIAFSSSAADSLKYALGQIGCDQRVIGQCDDLSFGPINPTDDNERLRWVARELYYDNYEEVLEVDKLFWDEASSPDMHHPVIWINLRCASEYAGFLEFLWRAPHLDFSVVDTTDIVFSGGRDGAFVARSLGEVAPEQIIEAQLIDRQINLSAADIENHKAAWKQLRTENASLRIVGTNGLVSAPINYFDDEISSFVRDDWTKCARVVAEVLFKQSAGPFRQTGDMLLCSRLRRLAEEGIFEHQGDLTLPRHSEVRRAGPWR